ncbi:MAG: type III pantothenate kinase [Propionivibrio sp.]|uniref:type III pantothenate kinase n=1 Tax=Propionivibrio sp. TaxID=2212460 RepID=UPI0025FB0F1F|nr:type III pantothenate kinase [Propionivibrio sp.]MBL0209171.1 type III pantothenate kinase [Propionivibrio sp.]
MKLIAIDAGNTRIKWGVHDGAAWVASGALPTGDAARLREVAAGWPHEACVVACNVAGLAVESAIGSALEERFPAPLWLRSSAGVCGVRNAYEQPASLGADRWAALIGAQVLASADCLVVCAGTATTVDWLDAGGTFRGGLILPGIDLMRASLARDTAQLPLAEGHFSAAPRNTMDAIVSGCLHAQIGAIERMFAGLPPHPQAICLLTGGAAPRIAPHLLIPFKLTENLVLDGLLRFAVAHPPC